MTYHKYSVKPFSGKNFRKNDADGAPNNCAICGKKTNGNAFEAVVIEGGSAWGDESDIENDTGMGAFSIGSDCHRKFVIKETK